MGTRARRSTRGEQGDASRGAPQDLAQRPDEVLRQLQERFGNAVAERLLLDAPANEFELYLADLLASERATGVDFSAYLPGQAPQEWSRFVQAWYRVLWAERGAATPELGSTDLGLALEAPDAVAPAAPAPESIAPVAGAPSPEPAAVQRSAGPGSPDLDDPAQLDAWFQALRSRSGSGRPLSAAEQAFMERVHGDALRDARIHEGSAAQQASQDIAARAFTVDSDIWVGESIDLGTREGAKLLAHEATHVLQNRAGRGATAESRVSEPGDALEHEATIAEGVAGRTWDERRSAWRFTPPGGLDSRAEFLSTTMLGRLPDSAGPAPDSLVRDALRILLTARAEQRLADASLALRAGLVASEREARVSGELADLRRAVAGAPATSAGLGLLLELGGAPTAAELEHLQESFAPYPSLTAQLQALLDTLGGGEVPAEDLPGADELDTDTVRTERTLALVSELAPKLGLSANRVDVHLDAAAGEKTRSAGTRGLAEDGAIFLDTRAFDPATRDARGLVAHELTHLAQEFLAPAHGADAARLAETEAAEAAWRAASGGAIEAPTHGLPTGHVAAEGGGGVDASGLVATRAANQATLDANKGSITPAPQSPGGDRNANASEDSERKLEQYEDGVDGVCEMIEDLDAFDDLCEAIDDEEPTQGHLSRVMANEHAARLPKMWQGALEGGEVAGPMQRAFNSEFDGRGFWEETEKAFEMICRRAKSMARPEPEAAAAKADAATAAANKDQAVEDGGESGEGVEAGEGGGAGGEAAALPAAIAALLDQDVEEVAPEIGAFTNFQTITDEQFDLISQAVDHQTNLSSNPPDFEEGRGAQVFEALTENFLGSMVSGATDQFIDGMVWDNIGKLGDMGMSALTKGKLGTPFVGQVIALAQTPPWTAGAWGFGEGSPFASAGQAIGNLGHLGSAFSEAEDLGDQLAILCAMAAELVGFLRDFIKGIRQILSTLSSLCYVVGGILIIVGIALLWLAGVGAPLVSAGGWLTRMGGVLSRINTVLGPAVIVLSGLATLLSTIAALTVPSDLYAQQLQGVGEDAGAFGEVVGAKVGDSLAEQANSAIASRFETRTSPPAGQEPDAGEGAELADRVNTQNQADLDRIADGAQRALNDDTGDNMPMPSDQAAIPRDGGGDDDGSTPRPQDGDDTTRAADGDDSTRAQDGDDGAAPQRSRLMNAVMKPLDMMGTSIRGVRDGISDINRGFSDPARFAQEGLSPSARAYVDGQMSQRIEDLNTRATNLADQVRALESDPNADPMEVARLQTQLNSTRQDIVDSHRRISDLRETVRGVEDTEQRLNRAEDGEQDQRVIQRELDAANKEVDEARQVVRNAEAEHRLATEANQRHTTDVETAQGDATRLSQSAGDKHTEAGNQDQARPLVPQAAEARTTADNQVNGLTGRNTNVEINGTSRQRRVTDVRVNDDGSIEVQVDKTRGQSDPQWVSSDQITNNRFRIEMEEAQASESNARTQEAEIDRLIGGSDRLMTEDQVNDLRSQATSDAEGGLRAQERLDQLNQNTPDAPDDDALANARSRLETAEANQSALTAELEAASGRSASAAAEVENDPNAASVNRHRDNVSFRRGEHATRGNAVAEHFRSTSSANAMGGIGSSSKAIGESVLAQTADWLVGLDNIKSIFPDNIANSAHAQKRGFTVGGMAEDGVQSALDAVGMGHRETPQELKALGENQASVEERRRAAFEALMSFTAPVDFQTFTDHRTKAVTAHEAYINSHAEALRAFKAEETVGEVAAATKSIAEQGKPVRDQSKSMAGPLAESKTTETQRKSQIDGSNSEVPEADGGLGGFVVELISKIGDNSDEMDEQPTTGGDDAGQAMADGQNTAKDESKDKSDQIKQASEANTQFLDQASELQGAQEGDLDANITAMEDREKVELGIQDEIKVKKAEHLAERDKQKGIVEENANAFMSEHAQLEAWRTEYNSRKAALEAEYS